MRERKPVGFGDIFKGWRVIFIGTPADGRGGYDEGQEKSITLMRVDDPRHPLELPVKDMKNLDARNHKIRF